MTITKDSAVGTLTTLQHTIDFRVELDGVEGLDIDETLEDRMKEEAESRSRECIINDFGSGGELSMVYVDDDGEEFELFGWWNIQLENAS